jgi:acetyl esterase/lipase
MRFPDPLHDAVSVCLRLVKDLHILATNRLVAGDSTDGGLVLGLLVYLRVNNYSLPAGTIPMLPQVCKYILSFFCVQ